MKKTAKLPLPSLIAAAALILGSSSVHADDHGNTAGTATRIRSSVTAGTISNYSDVDWFVFRPTVTGPATVSVLPNPVGSVQGKFFAEWLNSAQRPIGNTHGDRMSQVVSAGQTYYLRIRKLANMPMNPRAYRLKLSLPEAAVPIAAASTMVRASLETAQDANLFSFTMTASGLVNLKTRPPVAGRAPIGLIVELFDAAGRRHDLQWNNDIRRILPGAGRYFVRVTPSTVAPNTGGYALQLLTNSRATAVSTYYAGSFDVLQDRDFLRFTVSGSRLVRISSTGIPNIRASVYNAAGSRLALSNFSGPVVINKLLTTGTYYLLLEPNPAGGRTGNYRITIAR